MTASSGDGGGSGSEVVVLDLTVLDRLAEEADDEEGKTLLRRVVASYCSGELLREARRGRDLGDWELLERSAHNLKGLGYTIGTLAVAAVAGELEHSANQQDGGRCRILLSRLDGELDRAYRALAATGFYDPAMVAEFRSARRRSGVP